MCRIEQCPHLSPGLTDYYGEEFKELYEKFEAEGTFINQISTQDLWRAIIVSQAETGGPVIMFKDTCNRKSNQKCHEVKKNIRRTKPVAENIENAVLHKQLSLRQASADFLKQPYAYTSKNGESGHEHFVYSAAQDVKLVCMKEQEEEEELLKYVTICASQLSN